MGETIKDYESLLVKMWHSGSEDSHCQDLGQWQAFFYGMLHYWLLSDGDVSHIMTHKNGR